MARQEIMLPQLGEPISHYAHAVRFGDLLFVSGCAPLDEHGDLVGRGDVKAQTRQVLANLRATLAAVGLGPADVLKVTVYLTEIEDRPRINPLRRAFFGKTRPASTLVEVSALAVDGMRVEIEAIAGFTQTHNAQPSASQREAARERQSESTAPAMGKPRARATSPAEKSRRG